MVEYSRRGVRGKEGYVVDLGGEERRGMWLNILGGG